MLFKINQHKNNFLIHQNKKLDWPNFAGEHTKEINCLPIYLYRSSSSSSSKIPRGSNFAAGVNVLAFSHNSWNTLLTSSESVLLVSLSASALTLLPLFTVTFLAILNFSKALKNWTEEKSLFTWKIYHYKDINVPPCIWRVDTISLQYAQKDLKLI